MVSCVSSAAHRKVEAPETSLLFDEHSEAAQTIRAICQSSEKNCCKDFSARVESQEQRKMQGSPDLTDAHTAFYLQGCLLCVVVARSHLKEGRATQAQCSAPVRGLPALNYPKPPARPASSTEFIRVPGCRSIKTKSACLPRRMLCARSKA